MIDVVAFAEWICVEEFLGQFSSLDQIEGVYAIAFNEPKEVEFLYTTTVGHNLVSNIKLQEHYDCTDKRIILIASTNNMYKSVRDFFNDNHGCSATDFTPKSAKVIWQIVDRPDFYISFCETEESVKQKELLVNNYKQEFGGVPIGNKSFNDNDAIPSWSGFNYQGKGIILRAIQQINKLWKEDMDEDNLILQLKRYSIEIELREDFVLYEQTIPIEYVQVKATLAAETYSNYKKAIKQLNDHRNEGGNPEKAKCLLMSAAPIRNWKQDCGVSLYLYEDNCLGLLGITEAIKAELVKLLIKMQQPNDDYKVKIVYEYLCGLLDNRVHEIHNSGKGYQLCLYRDIWLEVKKSYTELKKNALFEAYEAIYQDSCEVLDEMITKRCESCKRTHRYYNCDTCPLEAMKDNFLLTDLIDYAQVLKPDIIVDGRTERQISLLSQVFAEDQLNSLLYQFQFADINNYRREANYHMIDMGEDNHIIPTLMNFRNDIEEVAISTTLSKIRQNISIRKVIDGKALTVESPHFKSKNILEENITNYKEMEKRILEEDGVNSFGKAVAVQEVNFTLVDKMSLISDLKEKSDKRE